MESEVCTMCGMPIISDPYGHNLYATLCSDCRAKVMGHLKKRNKKALEKFEKKKKRAKW